MAGNVIQTFAPYAMQLQQQAGIPASITLAQLVQESGYNLSQLATLYHNPFGVKWNVGSPYPYVTLQTTEWDKSQGKFITTTANFINYPSFADAFADRVRFLSQPVYRNLWGTTDPQAYANDLHTDGYATDPNYASELMQIIHANGLGSYDAQAGTYGGFPDTLPENAFGGAPVATDATGGLQPLQQLTRIGIYAGLAVVVIIVLFKLGGK